MRARISVSHQHLVESLGPLRNISRILRVDVPGEKVQRKRALPCVCKKAIEKRLMAGQRRSADAKRRIHSLERAHRDLIQTVVLLRRAGPEIGNIRLVPHLPISNVGVESVVPSSL